eukprot:scaffold18804_cov101-Isochrysis_galbana.AAC.4
MIFKRRATQHAAERCRQQLQAEHRVPARGSRIQKRLTAGARQLKIHQGQMCASTCVHPSPPANPETVGLAQRRESIAGDAGSPPSRR